IWVTGNGGLAKFDGSGFRTFTDPRVIPGRAVYGLVDDSEGSCWMLTQAGVLRWPAGELDRAPADSSYRVRYQVFDQQDGLPGAITYTNWGQMISRSPDGRIWVATDSGVASVDPQDVPGNQAPPPPVIEALRVDGRELVLSAATAIPS